MSAIRTNEIRRQKREEARKTAVDRLAEKLEAHADEILDTYLEAIRAGDWRAAEALYDRVGALPDAIRGRPTDSGSDRQIAERSSRRRRAGRGRPPRRA